MEISNISFKENYAAKTLTVAKNEEKKPFNHYEMPNYKHYSHLTFGSAQSYAFNVIKGKVHNVDDYLNQILNDNAFIRLDGPIHLDFALKSDPDTPIEQFFTFSKINGALNRNPQIAKILFQDKYYDGKYFVETQRTDVIKRIFNWLNDDNVKSLISVYDKKGDSLFLGGNLKNSTTIPRVHLLADRFSKTDKEFFNKMLSSINLAPEIKFIGNDKKRMRGLIEEFHVITSYLKGDDLVKFYQRRDEDGKTYLELVNPMLRTSIVRDLMNSPDEFAKILQTPFSNGSTFMHCAPFLVLKNLMKLYENDPVTLAKLFTMKDGAGRHILDCENNDVKCNLVRPFVKKIYNYSQLSPELKSDARELFDFACDNAKKYVKEY